MKFEHLHMLEAVARLGSITAASDELNISQSSVSRSLRQLEGELGTELFDRTRNRVELNSYGLLAAEYARSIMVEERRMVDAFRSISGVGRVLRVSSCAPSAMVPFMEFINREFPGTVFDTTLETAGTVRRRLLDRTTDLAITNRPDPLPTIVSEPFMVEELYALIPLDNELAQQDEVTFEELDGHTLLLDKTAASWSELMRYRMPSATYIEQTDLKIVVELARTTNYITFANDYSTLFEGLEGRKRMRISDPAARTTYHLQCLADGPAHLLEIVQAVGRVGVIEHM